MTGRSGGTFIIVNILLAFLPAYFFSSGFFSACHAAPDISSQFQQTACEVKINPLFNKDIPVHQGFLYSFQFKKTDLEDSLTSLLRAKVRSLNIPNENDFTARVVRVSSLKWVVLNFDGTKLTLPDQMPSLVKNEGTGSEIDVSTLNYIFSTPTDPMDESMIVCAADFEWQAYSGATLLPGWPKTQQAYGKFAFTVIDMEPPHNAAISPSSLYATSGDKISEFNDIISRQGLDAKYASQKNPAGISITIIDDNPFGDMKQSKLRHNLSNVDGFILVEAYREKYKQYDYNNPPKQQIVDPFDLESTIYETLDESAPDSGKFSFLAPIKISSIAGASVRSKKISGGANSKDNVAYFFYIPVEGLEAELEKLGAGLSKTSVHYASMSSFQPLDRDAKAEYKNRQHKALRLTFAACDSSGNWLVPDPSVLNDTAVFNSLINTVFSLNPTQLGKIKYNTHLITANLYVFDNKPPNPLIVMTNTETNHTDIFTLPNSDTSPAPYLNTKPLWEFDAAGNSEVMKMFSPEECERFKSALRISEDVRLIFKVMAYDNVNKSLVQSDLSLCHGISTPLTLGSANNKDSMRYTTWKISDPSCGNNSLLTEDVAGQKLFVFPEYIFRAPDPSKGQSVEFEVADTSPFRAPPVNLNEPFNPASSSSGCNTRKIKLVFDISPRSVSMTNMGNEVKTRSSGAGDGKK